MDDCWNTIGFNEILIESKVCGQSSNGISLFSLFRTTWKCKYASAIQPKKLHCRMTNHKTHWKVKWFEFYTCSVRMECHVLGMYKWQCGAHIIWHFKSKEMSSLIVFILSVCRSLPHSIFRRPTTIICHRRRAFSAPTLQLSHFGSRAFILLSVATGYSHTVSCNILNEADVRRLHKNHPYSNIFISHRMFYYVSAKINLKARSALNVRLWLSLWRQ